MSLYIQITSKCNMTCDHCGFACTARGKDMTRETFDKAIALAVAQDITLTIGGGEPTLHPHCKDFVLHAQWELAPLSNSLGGAAVSIITNGSNTSISLTLAHLAEVGTIHAVVSKDAWHDPIDPRVFAAFTKKGKDFYNKIHESDHDNREIRSVTNIIPVGRAKGWSERKRGDCVCNSLFITPLGKVYPCGCRKTCLGTLDTVEFKYGHFQGLCESSENYKEEMKNA